MQIRYDNGKSVNAAMCQQQYDFSEQEILEPTVLCLNPLSCAIIIKKSNIFEVVKQYISYAGY